MLFLFNNTKFSSYVCVNDFLFSWEPQYYPSNLVCHFRFFWLTITFFDGFFCLLHNSSTVYILCKQMNATAWFYYECWLYSLNGIYFMFYAKRNSIINLEFVLHFCVFTHFDCKHFSSFKLSLPLKWNKNEERMERKRNKQLIHKFKNEAHWKNVAKTWFIFFSVLIVNFAQRILICLFYKMVFFSFHKRWQCLLNALFQLMWTV